MRNKNGAFNLSEIVQLGIGMLMYTDMLNKSIKNAVEKNGLASKLLKEKSIAIGM
ncbi:MAG TPA: hypothetical protein VFL70_10190 [Bacteroidia bacterium]|nr:hypothetical protein [Bacteroidia bacterium]